MFRFNCHDVESTQREQATLCSFITAYVYNTLEHDLQLQRPFLPHSEGFVYTSPGALKDKRALLVLIQDAGSMHCGVWSWRMVVRECLNKGSQIPYILWAMTESWAVLLMNPNEGGKSPEEHVCCVWDCMISQVKWLFNTLFTISFTTLQRHIWDFSSSSLTQSVFCKSHLAMQFKHTVLEVFTYYAVLHSTVLIYCLDLIF